MRRVILADLPQSERERFYEFLVANDVDFVAEQSGDNFVARIEVVPPVANAARISGSARLEKSPVKPKQPATTPRSAAKPRSRSVTGAAPDPASQETTDTLKAAQSVLRRRYTRFCNLLPVLSAAPKAFRSTALLRFAEEVYDARYEKDALYLKNQVDASGDVKLPKSFPDFVYEFAAKRYGLKALVRDNCWGMVSTVEMLRGRHAGIDLYGKFLEEYYDTNDLLFFLFARQAIHKVVQRSKKLGEGIQDDESQEASAQVGEPARGQAKQRGKSQVPGTVLLQDIRLSDKQIYQVVKIAIDSRRPELRAEVIQKIDAAMMDPQEGKKNTLEPERLLAIATEAYHNSRELSIYGQEGEHAHAGAQKLSTQSSRPQDQNLPPEIKKEVRQVAQRLVSKLSENGGQDVNSQDVYQWALQVTLRRHKQGEFSEEQALDNKATSMDLTEMHHSFLGLMEQPEQSSLDDFAPSMDVLDLSAEEFESNLEDNVRQLLLSALSEVVMDALNSLADMPSERRIVAMKSALMAEFSQTADVLMECLVNKDWTMWAQTLKTNSIGSASLSQQQEFEKLHDEFQEVLNSEITAASVQQTCRAVVGSDELFSMIQAHAQQLTRDC